MPDGKQVLKFALPKRGKIVSCAAVGNRLVAATPPFRSVFTRRSEVQSRVQSRQIPANHLLP